MATDFTQVWRDQCAAAQDIRDNWGVRKATGYLIGEKFLNHVRAVRTRPALLAETPEFARTVCAIFGRAELERYFAEVRRVGAFGHVGSDEDFQTLRDAGALDEDPVQGAEDALLLAEAREWLLPGEPRT